MSGMPKPHGEAIWHLEGYVDESARLYRVPIQTFPFKVGRRPKLNLTLPTRSISQEHAEIVEVTGKLQIRDLNSTNGTFVNRRRIAGEHPLEDGDIVHFATVEFRLTRQGTRDSSGSINQTFVMQGELPQRLLMGTKQLPEMLRTCAVTPFFQPIIRLSDKAVVGHEVLGRGNYQGLPTNPMELFAIAASVGKEVELSEIFRRVGMASAPRLGKEIHIFLNTHPVENEKTGLLVSLEKLRIENPSTPITLEVHEAAVTDLNEMAQLKSRLRALKIGLAYDDFGAGQSRLKELTEVPPDILKFDIILIRDIHKAQKQSQMVLDTIVRVSRDLGVTTLAEGIECQEEADFCRNIGIDLAQGYFFGRPAPAPAG